MPYSRRYIYFLILILSAFSGFGLLSTVSSVSASGSLAESVIDTTVTHTIMIPIVMGTNGEAEYDLSIDWIEVTQAVQDTANSVPLVSGRQTIVRVYIRSTALFQLDKIRVNLSGIANGQVLVNSPLSASATIFRSSTRGNYTSTYNFVLPVGWLDSSPFTLTAQVDVDNVSRETNETNNCKTAVFTANQVAPLDLKIVPILYKHTPSGVTYNAPIDTISSIIYRLYPVPAMTVSLHPSLYFSGDLTQLAEWGRLLEAVDLLKTTENAPDSRVYYGLVPSTWFKGGYAGLGYIGWRTSIGLQLEDLKWGLDAGAYTAAHEIGHNLNSLHAPGCNAGNVDPAWPWLNDGHTHEYGLDLGALLVKMPTSQDIMGYCRDGGFWISGYTYRKLMVDQLAHGGVASIARQSQEVLYIRAILDANDQASLQPIYHLLATPSAESTASAYWVQLLDASGAELARYPVDVKTAEGTDFTFRMISALVPMPSGSVAQLRLYKGTALLTQRQLQSAPTLLSGLQLAKSNDGLGLSWSSNAQPALVRYTSDEGATWTTLAFDVTASELTIDPSGLSSGGYFEVSFADTTLPVRVISALK